MDSVADITMHMTMRTVHTADRMRRQLVERRMIDTAAPASTNVPTAPHAAARYFAMEYAWSIIVEDRRGRERRMARFRAIALPCPSRRDVASIIVEKHKM
eukprot:253036-Hanusia_phi.AAC.2